MTMTAERKLDDAGPEWAVRPGLPARRRGLRRTPRWWRDMVGSFTWASLLVVVALWLSNGGLQDLGGVATGLSSVGRLVGLLASDLLLIQVLLMARIPMVERVYGQDELARRHRLVGFASFNLMVVHIALITLGYAAADGKNLLGEAFDLVINYPGMLLALAGAIALVMVTVTSIKKARKKLRYESWHLLHLYAYLGVGLALPHQLWTGQEFLSSGWATLYWWSLWIAAAGAVLIWRVLVPVVRTLWHDLRVVAVIRESGDVVSVIMKGRRLDRLPVSAGQFFTWRFLSGKNWTRGHPYSLSSAPLGDTLRITVKALGDDSRTLAAVKPGTRVAIEGPFGRLHAGVRTRRKVTMLASGIGVTPLRALLEELPQGTGDITFIYRARDQRDLILRAELEALAAAKGARVYYVLGNRVSGPASWLPAAAGHLTDSEALSLLVPDLADHDVFLCGSAAWMVAARTAALGAGVPAERIHSERFSW
jgi:ferredoxin-NADP reductase/DMSO/TMAO reductase YedYZ heme-binding membrane subunit